MNSQYRSCSNQGDQDIPASLKEPFNDNQVVDVSEEQIKFVVFRAGGIRYAAYGSNVKEILTDRVIYPVPFLPEYLPGLINVRGEIESVIDISFFLGGKRAKQDKVMVMMVKCEKFSSAIIVDDVEDVVDLPISSLKPALTTLAGAARELVSGTVEFSGVALSVLDIEKLAAKVSI